MVLNQRVIRFGALLLLLVGALSPARVEGSSLPTSLSANVTDGVVHTSVNLSTFQNITAYQGSFVLPQFNGVLQGPNSTVLSGMVQEAIAGKDPSAKVTNLVLQVGSSPWTN